MSETQDIVIIGGGIIGASIAFFMSNTGLFSGQITVIEKDPGHKNSSTALSVGGVRHQFSTPANIQMSQFATHFIKNCDQYLGIDEAINLYFKENGYLFLATESGKETLSNNLEIQKNLGADVCHLTPDQIQTRFQWLNTEGLSGANYGLSGEGWFDPNALLQAFIQKAKSLGVKFIKGEVCELEMSKSSIQNLKLKSGKSISAGWVINAAGPLAANISGMAGIKYFPVESRKRQVHVFRCAEYWSDCPFVIDPSGVYFRPEGHNFICGQSPKADQDPPTRNSDLDFAQFEDIIWPILANRVKAFEAIRREHSWAGHYAYHVEDQNPIIGFHPEVKNIVFANGFSGHGLQHAPAVGRGITELLISGRYQSIDLSAFSFERIALKKLIRETEVV